jgi:hypothetical protein
MSEQSFDLPSLRGTETPQEKPRARHPFVKPTVQDLGGLKRLTLAGGSTP